jgi:hypothetical protein
MRKGKGGREEGRKGGRKGKGSRLLGWFESQ